MKNIMGVENPRDWARGVRVESRRAGIVLASDVPVLDGSITWDGRRDVPGELSFTAPVSIAPDTVNSPLACWGQELFVYASFTNERTTVEVPIGVFVITGWSVNNQGVHVTARDRWTHLVDAPAPFPRSPAKGVSVDTEARTLAYPVPVKPTGKGMIDRVFTWGNDRVNAMHQLAENYGCRWLLNGAGEFTLTERNTRNPVARLNDVEEIISVTRSDRRDQITEVIAWTQQNNDSPVASATAYNTHPHARSDIYGIRRELINANSQAGYAELVSQAQNRINEFGIRETTTPFTLVPDPRLDLWDYVAITTGEAVRVGTIVGISYPLLVGDTMRIDLAEEL